MDDVELGGWERRGLWLTSAAIALLVFLQAPGRIVPETKLDLTLDPVGYLARALTAWDPSGGFGRVQNQAVGYLFPMGAFSAAGHGVGISPWIVQRLWISLVLVVGLWGAHRVMRAVGVSSPWGRALGALAYALAPATLAAAAFQSAGQLPYALAPWVLVPLLTAKSDDSPRRVAARSALVVAAMGGVNGASAFAVLPLAVIWFLTRTPGPARRRLAAWWFGGVVAATLWWLIPLAVSVRYGIRFTDFTENAGLTTVTESATEVLRGTGNWLSFVQTDVGRWLPGAWSLSSDRVAIVGSIAVAAAGVWGLARRDLPGRSWLVPSFVLGTVAVGMGYDGSWGGGLSGFVHQLLDGPLVPFRNVHKFAAVVRLPMAVGLAHLISVALAHRQAHEPVAVESSSAAVRRPSAPVVVSAVAVLAIVLAITPAAGGRLTAPGSFTDVPGAWRDAAAWVDAHQDGRRSLLFPGSAFGEYEWGRPLDEPASSLLETEWAVRDLIPLGGNGSTRLLDGMDEALATESMPPGFVPSLQRAGVRYLIVRNDLDLARTGGPRPATVRRLLATAPELELVASFGPIRTDPGSDGRVSSPPGAPGQEAFRAIDVYEVPEAVDRATAYPEAGAAVVSGGPEAMLQLDPSLTDGRAVVLAVDEGASSLPDPVLVATDTARRRDVRFGAIRDNASYTLTADEGTPVTGDDPVDRWPADEPEGLTSAQLEGAVSLTDSRRPTQPTRPEHQPFAAFDGNPRTVWSPGKARPGEWVQATFDEPVDLGAVTVRIPETTGKRIGSVSVETDHGRSEPVAIGPDGSATVEPPDGATRRLRVVMDSVVGVRPVFRVGISDIEAAGVDIHRPLVVPSPAPSGAEVVSLARSHVDRFNLNRQDEEGDLDRIVEWGGEAQGLLHGTASAQPGDDLDAVLADAAGDDEGVEATATSTFRDHPAFAPSAAVDGDPLTAWVSQPQATAPAITVRWDGDLSVDSLQVQVLNGVSDPVHRVVVHVGDEAYERELDASGQISIPATQTDAITISFPTDPKDRTGTRRVAVSEVAIPALLGRTAPAAARSTPVTFDCGDGPTVLLDGDAVSTRAAATVGQLLDGTPVDWEACEPIALDHGALRLTSPAGDGALLTSTATIDPATGIDPPAPPRSTKVTSWHADRRTIELGPGEAAILATTENRNDGWVASIDGTQLTPIRVDGWRQGWKVPAGEAATVELRFRPATTQRLGLLVGLAALIALIAAALVRPRPRPDRVLAPSSDRSWSPGAVYGLLAIAGIALGGPLVLVAVPVVLVARRTTWLTTVAAAAVVAAGIVAISHAGSGINDPSGTFSGPAQAFAVTAILAVGASLLTPARAPDDGGSAEPVGPPA